MFDFFLSSIPTNAFTVFATFKLKIRFDYLHFPGLCL